MEGAREECRDEEDVTLPQPMSLPATFHTSAVTSMTLTASEHELLFPIPLVPSP